MDFHVWPPLSTCRLLIDLRNARIRTRRIVVKQQDALPALSIYDFDLQRCSFFLLFYSIFV